MANFQIDLATCPVSDLWSGWLLSALLRLFQRLPIDTIEAGSRGSLDKSHRNPENSPPSDRESVARCAAAEGVAPANSQAKRPFGTRRLFRTLESDGIPSTERAREGCPS